MMWDWQCACVGSAHSRVTSGTLHRNHRQVCLVAPPSGGNYHILEWSNIALHNHQQQEQKEGGMEWIMKFPLKSLISMINAGGESYLPPHLRGILIDEKGFKDSRRRCYWQDTWVLFQVALTSPWGRHCRCFQPGDGVKTLLPAVVASTSVVFLSPMKSNW